MKKLIGVAITDFSDAGLTALKWTRDFLMPPSDDYKICIIRIQIMLNLDPPQHVSHSECTNWDEIESCFSRDLTGDMIEKFQGLADVFQKGIWLKTYAGKNIQDTLQFAINENLQKIDTLVIAGGSSIMGEKIELQLSGCSIVLVNIDPGANKRLSLSPAAPEENGTSAMETSTPSSGSTPAQAQPSGETPEGQNRAENSNQPYRNAGS